LSIFAVPFIFKTGVNFVLFKFLELDSSIGGGFSVISTEYKGTYLSRTYYTFKPNISADFHAYFTPVKYFKTGWGVNFTMTFNTGEFVSNLLTVSPSFTIGASF